MVTEFPVGKLLTVCGYIRGHQMCTDSGWKYPMNVYSTNSIKPYRFYIIEKVRMASDEQDEQWRIVKFAL